MKCVKNKQMYNAIARTCRERGDHFITHRHTHTRMHVERQRQRQTRTRTRIESMRKQDHFDSIDKVSHQRVFASCYSECVDMDLTSVYKAAIMYGQSGGICTDAYGCRIDCQYSPAKGFCAESNCK